MRAARAFHATLLAQRRSKGHEADGRAVRSRRDGRIVRRVVAGCAYRTLALAGDLREARRMPSSS